MKPQLPPIAAGDVLMLEEPDDVPGVGPLRLRITAVGGIEGHPDGRWLNLRGVTLRADGTPVNGRERYVLVRVGALHHALEHEENSRDR